MFMLDLFSLTRNILSKHIVKVTVVSKSRTIMTSSFNATKAVEELQQNPYFEKYSSKISNLQKKLPVEFVSRLEEIAKKKNVVKDDQLCLEPKPGQAKSASTTFTKPRALADVMKIELIADKTADDIIKIWVEYHKNKDVIAASLPVKKYSKIQERGQKFPMFLLPLPRDQGYEFIVCQFSGNEVHFTPLVSYKTHNENAPECLTMVYYTDLQDDKCLILMRGEFDKDVLNPIEAQCLANQLQLYYGEDNEKRTQLLERFTYDSEDFKHMDVIAELESLNF